MSAGAILRRLAATLVFAALIATPLVAVTLQAPQAKGALYNPRDYPQSAMRNDEMGVARIRVTVSPTGKPIRCAVIVSSDTESLDKASCAVMLARGSYTPAQDATGQPLHGVVRRLVSWSFGLSSANHRAFEERNQPSDIDIIVTVTALPAGLVAPVAVIADVLVTPAGEIADCNAEARGAVPVELAQLACAQAKALSHALPALDYTGATVTSVQQIKIAFITEPAAK